jgi:hypothetical protein
MDRFARLLIGIVCIATPFAYPNVIGNDMLNVLTGLFGAVNLWAAAVANCPVYHVSGLSTYKGHNKEVVNH